ncbi:hypothetical protein HY285_02475 [Candidatus Peregrinibacteria bacterium]|nr:hypothetical protein [Candidatus Peregrinibacteria bacterium]MBI3816386.1 hypothetical protein [Candidatus Peregrinibacteria bacterium]
MTFGTGIPLRQFSPHLRHAAQRHRIILDCAERDSVIEGLPRFSKKMKKECLRELKNLSVKP